MRGSVPAAGMSAWCSRASEQAAHLAVRIVEVAEVMQRVGQTATHAGSSPSSTRWMQNVHLSA